MIVTGESLDVIKSVLSSFVSTAKRMACNDFALVPFHIFKCFGIEYVALEKGLIETRCKCINLSNVYSQHKVLGTHLFFNSSSTYMYSTLYNTICIQHYIIQSDHPSPTPNEEIQYTVGLV